MPVNLTYDPRLLDWTAEVAVIYALLASQIEDDSTDQDRGPSGSESWVLP